MKDNNIRQKLSNDKGLTLLSLIITVIVMLIIVSVSIYNGTQSLDNTRLKGFYAKLEIVQRRADDIVTTNEEYTIDNGDGTKTTVFLKKAGDDLKDDQIELVQRILDDKGITLVEASDFRYFTSEELYTVLGLSEIEYDVFIHFDSRTVIAKDGIKANGNEYYMLENNVFLPEYIADKGKPRLRSDEDGGSLTVTIDKYGSSKYKIKVTPVYYTIQKNIIGYLKYKKTTTKYWETSDNLEMIIDSLGVYNIIYEDVYGNKIEDKTHKNIPLYILVHTLN